MIRRYVVRVARENHPHFDNPLIECFRYAGLVVVHNDDIFDILPPHGVDSKVWAEQNAARISSFGYNAVSAPEWKS